MQNTCTKCNSCFFRKGEVLPIWKFYKKNKKWSCYFKVAIFIISLCLKNLLPYNNFNINNKNMIPSKFILVFNIQIKWKMCKTIKIYLFFEMLTVSSLDYKWYQENSHPENSHTSNSPWKIPTWNIPTHIFKHSHTSF